MKPHPIVISILSKLSNVIPTWRIIPNEDIIDRAIKSEEWREEVRGKDIWEDLNLKDYWFF